MSALKTVGPSGGWAEKTIVDIHYQYNIILFAGTGVNPSWITGRKLFLKRLFMKLSTKTYYNNYYLLRGPQTKCQQHSVELEFHLTAIGVVYDGQNIAAADSRRYRTRWWLNSKKTNKVSTYYLLFFYFFLIRRCGRQPSCYKVKVEWKTSFRLTIIIYDRVNSVNFLYVIFLSRDSRV